LKSKTKHLRGENAGLKAKIYEAEEKSRAWRGELDSFQEHSDIGVPLNADTWDKLIAENTEMNDLIKEIKVHIKKAKDGRIHYSLKLSKLN
jgi:hypothetical protein